MAKQPAMELAPFYSRFVVSSSNRPNSHPQTNSEEAEEYKHLEYYLASLPYAKFTNLGSKSPARIAAWNLTSRRHPIQSEGIVTYTPRGVVDRGSIKQGKEYSGVFIMTSLFKSGREWIKKTGTAFAVSKFHVLTSAHLMFDLKLGPAKSAFLSPDERQGRYGDRGKRCVAVACHVNYIKTLERKGGWTKNDFCMVAVEEPFDSGVRIPRCHNGPGPSYDEDGLIIGFPKDMPEISPGKRLISSTGSVYCREKNGVLLMQHKINTVEGNSGSPVIVNSLVVGIHSGFIKAKGYNEAAAVNRNGNTVEDFSAVLRYMRAQHARFRQDVGVLGKARGVTHPGEVLTLFG
ncbi:trypsin-like cysteine/serine peptidase domain-containing protein [Xylaria bambusicola]|uniref:trypsin-like cysteine/serine peptidase domain-containing protein n=1 Tax=Xylaria bambusicola TaxID=326684 RepID=UPI002008768A|nr:trypsin-like cysteine/serine peptidase domain-containing protein [Xylaria bambusicola]KAI0513332.1 trypsin-like cysteine/serine peptidase domain-containing protein [Xylaria bambusicola]